MNVHTNLSIVLATALLLTSCSDKKVAPPSGEATTAPSGKETKGKPHAEEEGHDHEKEEGEPHGEGEEKHDEVITLTPEALRSAQLQLAQAEAKPLVTGLIVPARITFTQQGVARVASRVPGRLATIQVALGQKVKKGEVLGHLESPELGQARADYLSAATKARVAEQNFRREKELLAKGITSERDMREAESTFVTAEAERNAADGRLHALGLSDGEISTLRGNEHYSSRFPAISPLTGTVVEISGTVGQAVEAATSLFTVADLTELWVQLDLTESQLPQVHAGQPVEITVQARAGQRFTGRVDYIGDVVDEKTRTIPVRVVVSNTEGALKPGMFAQAEIATTSGATRDSGSASPTRIVVPREAVQKVGEEQVVFVPAGENRFRPVEVQTGASSAQDVEILSGLQPGTSFVTQGAFILKSELSKESMGEGHSH
ncbi:efflux RND transporter periplasmic adaptor subunit [Myxococcus llanfairpwllgwyngyllgogerychwyrndrobwllllantysiliogogogochensis]|uniref:Efflux RND transporter periplasmic adaptor subunit n=1 Tax=Myxococcus llanfairpwllgwyngyllgogerychwyrndrobwllllantysiliogogogochensis TaxID=2590453 RepID=A0A540X2K7_9BACT|nr:efflux RND transporter periplasmic adaptor subunit [Myxococcus llanfairpwllgwyngyllgogerychwyrndrobwllllantysiliogogogochensis]TQF15502.1 efflux RND transporter periplasmic adaptor subunit [Myxococcus llanfairpwllgwyngyllgogerychwyrndrobwllllantysiliogogogochensis]